MSKKRKSQNIEIVEDYEIKDAIFFKKSFLDSKMYSESTEFNSQIDKQTKHDITFFGYIRVFIKFCFE